MRKIFGIASAGLLWACGSAAAGTPVSGIVSVPYAASGNPDADSRPCFFFQIDNQPQWYAIAYSSPGAAALTSLAMQSKLLQQAVTFWMYDDTSECGFPLADDLYFGTIH